MLVVRGSIGIGGPHRWSANPPVWFYGAEEAPAKGREPGDTTAQEAVRDVGIEGGVGKLVRT